MIWSVLVAAFGLISLLLVLFRMYRRAGGTTLLAPHVWALVAISVFTGYEAAYSLHSILGCWRLAVLAGTLCPFLALLGAKRPQNVGWQFVVGAFWLTAALPSFVSFMFYEGQATPMHELWTLLLAALILGQWANYACTRYLFSITLVSLAQGLLLAQALEITTAPYLPLFILLLLLLGQLPATFYKEREENFTGLWRDFRDNFGALWTLRIADSINSSREDFQLTWQGLSVPWRELTDSQRKSLQQALMNHLRRFESPQLLRAAADSFDGSQI